VSERLGLQFVITGPSRPASEASRLARRDPVIHEVARHIRKVTMDHCNSGLSELRIFMLKSATADLSVSQRQPLALRARGTLRPGDDKMGS